MPSRTSDGGADAPSPMPVRVFRALAGHTATLLALSPAVEGIITHWVKPRNEACRGPGCPDKWHKGESGWRGYFAALLWERAAKLWVPVAAEVSEFTMQQLRGLYARGQQWEFRRAASLRGQHPPTQARVTAHEFPAPVPPPFDILPCLRVLYRYPELVLGVENPLPARVEVEPLRLPGPGEIEAPRAASDVEEPRIRSLVDESKRRFGG